MNETPETMTTERGTPGGVLSGGEAGYVHALPAPYYDEDGVTLYCGDTREVLLDLSADALVTDPPYGVALGSTKGAGGKHGLSLAAYESFDDSYDEWMAVVPPALELAIDKTKRGAVFTGPHINERTCKGDARTGG